MTRRRARLYLLLLFMGCLGLATGLVLLALRDNISYFRTPTEIVTGAYPERGTTHSLRLGGLVETGSLHRTGDTIIFRVTDLKNTLTVSYRGIVPDLFREGQGVVAEGKMAGDTEFVAATLLAKHDEKYTPPEVARALRPAPSSPVMAPPAASP